MLGAGGHDVNNVNNVQCLITVSIGKTLSPGEETWAVASILTARECQTLNPHETYSTNSASEDDPSSEYQPDNKLTVFNPKAADDENHPPREAGECTTDTQTFGTTSATCLGEESVNQSEPAAETLPPHQESQVMAKGAKQLESA